MPRLREEQRIDLGPDIRRRILRESGFRCAHCNKLLRGDNEKEYTIEHVVPLRKGGSNNPRNLIALCYECNNEKQDDIIAPEEYYTFAPEWKLREVCATFEDYLKNVDWLAYDTLFKLDRFELKSQASAMNPRSGKIFHMPHKYPVRKMHRAEVAKYLFEYTAYLDTLDKTVMTYHEEDINTTYYAVYNSKGEILLIVSPYIMETDFGEPDGVVRKAVFFDFFVNPKLKLREPNDHASIAHILQSCLYLIRDTIEGRDIHNRNVIDMIYRTPKSDLNAQKAFILFQKHYHPQNHILVDESVEGGKVLCEILRLYNGTAEHLKAEAKAANTTRDEFTVDITQRQDKINERMVKSRQISNEKIHTLTKKEKKQRGKKPKRRKS